MIILHCPHGRSKRPDALIRQFSRVAMTDDGTTVTVDDGELREKHHALVRLWRAIKDKRHSQLFVGGAPAGLRELEQYRRPLLCCEQYHRAVVPASHCWAGGQREGWGCKHLTAIDRYVPTCDWGCWPRFAYWFQFGEFDLTGAWVVDKSALLAALEREARLNHLRLCPRFCWKRIEEIVASLPDEIDPHVNKAWEYRYDEFAETPERAVVPVGVKPVLPERGPKGLVWRPD